MTSCNNPWDDIDPHDSDEFLAERRAELEALLIAQGEKPRYAAYLAETLTDDEVARWLAPTRRSQAEILAWYKEINDGLDALVNNDIPF
jgi:hypothetical protein